MSDNADLAALIRNIPDYPKPGIMFRDVSSLLLDADGYRTTIDRLAAMVDPDTALVAGIEARGFIVASGIAYALGLGQLMLRKPGKLPGEKIGINYTLEYGTDRLEIHEDAVGHGDTVLIVDDVLATGGTAEAAIRLVEGLGATVAGLVFLIELDALGGRSKLSDYPVASVLHF